MLKADISLAKSLVNLFAYASTDDPCSTDSVGELNVDAFVKADGEVIQFRELPLKSVQKREIHRIFSVGGLGTITLEINPETGVMKISAPLSLKDVTMKISIEMVNHNRRA